MKRSPVAGGADPGLRQALTPATIIRRLFFDIETSPNVGFFWRPGYNVRLSPENIIHERQIITIAWKWQGEKAVHHLTWDWKVGRSLRRAPRTATECRPYLAAQPSDGTMIGKFLPVLARADEVVAHFGDGFDVPWIRARALINGFVALPIYKTVDTKAWASKYFSFNSNKLDYLAEVMGIGCKLRTDYQLWVDIVLHKNATALARMVRYNKHDVVLLEKVWQKLSLIGPVKTHVGVLCGHEKWTCPRCASDQVHKVRRYVTAKGTEQQQMRCRGCGGYYNISATARKDYEESCAVKAN